MSTEEASRPDWETTDEATVRRRAAVLECLETHGDQAMFEIAARFPPGLLTGLSPRPAELIKAGLVTKTSLSRINPQSRRSNRVYRLTTPAERAVLLAGGQLVAPAASQPAPRQAKLELHLPPSPQNPTP